MEMNNNVEKVKYVAVELIGNNTDDVKNIECGLFMGLTRRKDVNGLLSTFMVVALTNKTVKILNLGDYGIVTIEIVEGMTRFTSIFKDTKSDQSSAVATLDFIIGGMDIDGRLLKNDLNKELIDVETYSEYDHWVISEKSNLNSYGPDNKDGNKKPINAGFVKPKDKPPEKKPELFFIERKDPLEEKDALCYMHDAVVNLDAKTIKVLVCDVDIQTDGHVAAVKDSKEVKTYDGDFYDAYGLY